MKTIASSVLTLIFGIGASPAFCAGIDAGGVPQYDPKTEIDFSGTIVKVHEVAPSEAFPGFHVTIQTKAASVDVYLGPAEFIKRLDVPLRVGLKDFGVKGSKVRFAGNDVVLACEVSVGGTVFTLRDERGFPNWITRSEPTTGF